MDKESRKTMSDFVPKAAIVPVMPRTTIVPKASTAITSNLILLDDDSDSLEFDQDEAEAYKRRAEAAATAQVACERTKG